MINRIVKLPNKQSFFLFGARGTGKSTLLKALFPSTQAVWFDLLDLNTEARLQQNPMEIERELDAKASNRSLEWVVVDEIQKIPALLDVIHRNIERKRFKFALTGSSARKLKRGSANLLAGRAIENHLFPLTFLELENNFSLESALSWGTLPGLIGQEDAEKRDFLRTYANTYLREEIQIEQLVRKIAPFRSFLEIAAQCSGQILNYSKIARDVGSDPVSIQTYFEILEDTLIGCRLPAFEKSIRKRQRKNPKFYLFDLGVSRALKGQLLLDVRPGTYEFGVLFEQLIVLEIQRLCQYFKNDFRLSYLRTKDDVEVDMIVERPGQATALIEIKSTDKVRDEDVKAVTSILKDFHGARGFCLSRDPREKMIGEVHCLPWDQGIREILGKE